MGAAENGRVPTEALVYPIRASVRRGQPRTAALRQKSFRVSGQRTSVPWKRNLTLTKVTTLSAEKGNRLMSTIVLFHPATYDEVPCPTYLMAY